MIPPELDEAEFSWADGVTPDRVLGRVRRALVQTYAMQEADQICGYLQAAMEEAAEASIVTVPDVDTLEARVARIESMVADMHSAIGKFIPLINAMSQEMAEKGPVGMLGYLMAALRNG